MSSTFADKLCAILHATDGSSLPELSRDLMQEFLRFGSETPDNVNCFEHVEYGIVQRPSFGETEKGCGLKLKGKNILLADILNMAEDLDLPDDIKEYFPDLTDREWQAVMRMATMILIAFESDL